MPFGFHPDLLEHLVGAPLDVAIRSAHDLEGKRDIFENGFMGKKFVVLEYEAHVAPEIGNARRIEPEGIHALDDDLPLVCVFRAEEDFEEGGLARAAGAGNEDELSLVYGKADVAQGGDAFIIFCNPVELDHGINLESQYPIQIPNKFQKTSTIRQRVWTFEFGASNLFVIRNL